MPRKSKDELNDFGYVYKLHHKCQDLGDNFYIGSTVNHYQRWGQHKESCQNQRSKHYHYNVYKFIRENGTIDAWEMEIIQTYENITSRQLERHEQEFRDQLKPNLNMRKCGTDISSIYQYDKQEYNKKRCEMYRKENKDTIKEKLSEKVFCDVCKKYGRKGDRAQHIKSQKHQKGLSINDAKKIPDSKEYST